MYANVNIDIIDDILFIITNFQFICRVRLAHFTDLYILIISSVLHKVLDIIMH